MVKMRAGSGNAEIDVAAVEESEALGVQLPRKSVEDELAGIPGVTAIEPRLVSRSYTPEHDRA